MSIITRWLPAWMHAGNKPVLYRSVHQNLYHCTVQKSASQWLRGILSDPRTFQYCGLASYQYQQRLPGKYDPRKLTERRFQCALPEGTIAAPIYIDYEGFVAIPKPASYRAFFVMRDPRDIVVSWYFSAKHSHPSQGDIERIRLDLNRRTEPDGLLFAIDYLAEYGLFAAQRSWVDANDSNVLLLRFEDMVGPDQMPLIHQLMDHCDIRIPHRELAAVLKTHSFERLSGRRHGDENVHAHYRKGVVGDWRNHFTDAVLAHFMTVAGDVLETWHYN